MEKVRIKRDTLIEALRTGREEHARDFKEAVEGFREEAGRAIEEAKQKLDSNDEDLSVHLAYPSNHDNDYAVKIAMLELSEDTVIEVTQAEFRAYVLNDWTWRREWLVSNSAYSGNIARKAR